MEGMRLGHFLGQNGREGWESVLVDARLSTVIAPRPISHQLLTSTGRMEVLRSWPDSGSWEYPPSLASGAPSPASAFQPVT